MTKHFQPGLLSLLLLLLSLPPARAQYTTFQQVYPTSADQSGRDVLETADGGYILLAMTETSVAGDTNIFVVRTNNLGDTLWTRSYGGTSPDYAYKILATPDNGYLIAGYTSSIGAGSYDSWLIKINSTGAMQWNKTYGGSGDDQAKDVIATSDGNYMLTGRTNSPNANSATNYDAYLTKVDSSGTELWTKYYGGTAYETGRCLSQTLDGGYVFTGMSSSNSAGLGDIYLVRTNAAGDTTWTKKFGGFSSDDGNEVLSTSDGGFVICAETMSFGDGDFDIQLLKTDANGSMTWNKLYGGTDKDVSHMLQKTTDGGYIIAGISRSFGWSNPQMWLLKTNAAGDTLWSRDYGSFDHEHCYAFKQTSDGGYVALGHTKSFGPNMSIMFLKLNDVGTMATAIGEAEMANAPFSVFPNPTDGEVRINWGKISDSKLTVTNMLGQVVVSEDISESNSHGTTVIDLKDEIPGMYFFTLTDQNKTYTSRVILK